MKKCKKCQEIKPVSDFHKRSSSPDGLTIYCKCCNKLMMKPKSKYKACKDTKAWASRNPDKVKQAWAKYYQENKKDLAIKRKIRNQIPERQLVIKAWREANKDKLNLQRRKRRQTPTPYQIIEKSLRDRFNKVVIKMKSGTKHKSCLKLVGCEFNELKQHIESQFLEGMNWGNHGNGIGKWNIDHIKPLVTFDLHDIEQQLIAFNYLNLRPLWFMDNMKRPRKNYGTDQTANN